MFFIIIALAVIAAILLLILLLKINMAIDARNSRWELTARALGVVVLRRKYEVRREFGELLTLYSIGKKEKRIVSVTDIIKNVFNPDITKAEERAGKKLFGYINKKAKYNLNVKISIGLEDAFSTAMLCGVIQAARGALLVLNDDKRHSIRVDVVPAFGKRCFSFDGDCIIALPLVNIITGYLIYQINKRR